MIEFDVRTVSMVCVGADAFGEFFVMFGRIGGGLRRVQRLKTLLKLLRTAKDGCCVVCALC